MVNPRAELRVPLTDLLQLGLFLDAGNLWIGRGTSTSIRGSCVTGSAPACG